MKINFNTELLDIDGKAIKITKPSTDPKKPGKETAITLKKACIDALLGMTDKDKAIDGTKKFELYDLAIRLNKGGDISLKAEEVVLLKQRIGAIYLPLIVGRCYDLLECKKGTNAK